MAENDLNHTRVELQNAADDGRRQGLAIAALALGLISFLNLLGAEKSILAIVLAVVAMSGSASKLVRRRAGIAIGLGLLHLATVAAVLLIFRDELGQLIELLNTLA